MLWLKGNNLQGELPLSLGLCKQLENLNLAGNINLGGRSDTAFPLRYFDVHSTAIGGRIKEWISNMSEVQVLSIRNSNISGELPNGLRFLRILSVGGSHTGGGVPEDIRIDPAVRSLDPEEYTVYVDMGAKEYRDGVCDFAQPAKHRHRLFKGGIPVSLDTSAWRSLFLSGNDWVEERIRERAALEDFFNGCGGDMWENNKGWLDMPRDLSHLYGVTMNLSGKVIKIELHENRLASTDGIPDVFEAFKSLQVLDLSGNILLRGTNVCLCLCLCHFGYYTIHLIFDETTGLVPLSLLRLPHLRDLNLLATNLTSWPCEWSECITF